MTETQRLFDEYCAPACPEELAAPLLHRVLALEAIAPFIWGGKGVGSQGDGCVQLVAKSDADREEVMRILEGEAGLSCLALDLGPSIA
jgi:hypothetical protein